MMASPSGEEHDMTSQSSHLIPEYANLCISVLIQRKIIQEKDNTGNVIPTVFRIIALFSSVSMSGTKSILPEIESFTAKLLHHEERAKLSP